MHRYDLLLKNARVIDPANRLDAPRDIALKDGKIARIETEIPEQDAEKVLFLDGLILTPGLIDSHVHLYHSTGLPQAWAGDYSLQPDYFNFKSGVTTMVDTGSAGSFNFSHFRATVMERCQTRVCAFLNIADYGMSSLLVEQFPERNHLKRFLDCYHNNRDLLVGIKIAHYEKKDWKDLDYAQRLQAETDSPIMVDFGVFKKERPYAELLETRLKRGDISTHCFRGPVPVLDEAGKVYPYLWRAKKKGIKFDLGHGAGSFLFRNAVPAMQQGFFPDCVSTDLHGLSINGPAADMATTLSKVKACSDISLSGLFELVTSSPAACLGLSQGNLSVGTEADLAAWAIHRGTFGYADTGGGRLTGSEKLECELTILRGDIVWDRNARAARPYRELSQNYGFDPEAEALIRPQEDQSKQAGSLGNKEKKVSQKQ